MDLDWQISSTAQICHQTPLLSKVKPLDIRTDTIRLSCKGGRGRHDELCPVAGVYPYVSDPLYSEAAHMRRIRPVCRARVGSYRRRHVRQGIDECSRTRGIALLPLSSLYAPKIGQACSRPVL